MQSMPPIAEVAALPELTITWRVAVATLCGLAVGVEREWSGHARESAHRFAGIRTFLLFGLLGGVCGALVTLGYMLPAAALLAGGVALAVAALAVTGSRSGSGVDATTETSAVTVLALGVLAGAGHLELASGAAALMVLALVEKARLHDWVRRIDERELLAALRFAVLALVVLPILPNKPVAALAGVQPRALWAVVLMFSALNFASYMARRMAGPSRGYGITGLLGGLVSSTAVTITFARESRRHEDASQAIALGALAATIAVVPKVLVVTWILNQPMGARLTLVLLPPLVVGGAMVALAMRTTGPAMPAAIDADSRSPLGLWSAIQLAVVLQVALTALQYVEHLWGAGGVLASAVVLGVTNANALTLTMSKLGTTQEALRLGSMAIGVGVLTGILSKLFLTVAMGSAIFRRTVAGGLLLLAAASGAGIWLATRF